ncbi:hypothetical protein EXIGLDRAFT_721646 [Exidia glandulosa HHB12029]|uniref:Uncharacterized protein n=1 Tax=Exidia glandulosa HHB12029 TaxID=1314781 RepID=A0A165FKW4_EXIGL|nr:hypothetical protein EXIGLDRAFT_721646 [Exidia glandulosa HHB12029]
MPSTGPYKLQDLGTASPNSPRCTHLSSTAVEPSGDVYADYTVIAQFQLRMHLPSSNIGQTAYLGYSGQVASRECRFSADVDESRR